MNAQPEALRLADALETFHNPNDKQAAAELRRLHASCEDYAQHKQRQDQRVLELNAQRDALLEALKDATKTIEHLGYPLAAIERARAAIKAVEETK